MKKIKKHLFLYCFSAFGAFFSIIGLIIYIQGFLFFQNAQKTTGIIISTKVDDSGESIRYWPVIKYAAKEDTIEMAMSQSLSRNMEPGSKVAVFYNPENPDEVMLNGFDHSPLLFVAGGFFFFLVGMIIVRFQTRNEGDSEMLRQSGRHVTSLLSDIIPLGHDKYLLRSQWTDPSRNKLYTYEKEKEIKDPAVLDERCIPVLINPAKPERFIFDLSDMNSAAVKNSHLICPQCDRHLKETDINLAIDYAKCRGCGIWMPAGLKKRENFLDKEQLASVPPKSVVKKEENGQLILEYKWWGPKFIFLTCLMVLITAIYTYQLLSNPDIIQLIFIVFWIFPFAALVYFNLAGWFNKTKVILDKDYLTVWHGPVHGILWGKGKQFATENIETVFHQEKILQGRSRPGDSGDGGAIPFQGLHVKLKNGQKKMLFTGMDMQEQAVFIRDEVNKYLLMSG